MKRRRKLVFAVCYLAYVSLYVARINLSVSAPALKDLSILSSAQLGALGSAFSVVYAAGRLINGSLSDRVDPRIMICTGLLVSGLSNLAFSAFPRYTGLLIFWIINAFGQSMLWSSLLCVMSKIYDEQTVKKANSYLVTSVASGNIAAILVAMLMMEKLGVKWAFIVPGLLTILMGTACVYLLAGLDGNEKTRVPAEKKKPQILQLDLIRNDKQIRYAAIPTLFHGIIKDNVTLWMTVIAVDRYAVHLEESALFVLLIPAIGFVGRTLYPVAYRFCSNQEHLVSIFAFIICIAAASMLCISSLAAVPAIICLGVIYAAASMINTSMVSIYPTRFAAKGYMASTSGLMDFITYLGAGIGSIIYGNLVDDYGYTPMFLSWVVLSVFSSLILYYLRRNNQKEQKEAEK